jgi:hypothetical protein
MNCKPPNKGKQATIDEDSVDTHDPDLHPLATLHLENFTDIGKMISKSWYTGIEQREVVFAKRQCNEKEQVQRFSYIQELMLICMRQLRRSERLQVALACQISKGI